MNKGSEEKPREGEMQPLQKVPASPEGLGYPEVQTPHPWFTVMDVSVGSSAMAEAVTEWVW